MHTAVQTMHRDKKAKPGPLSLLLHAATWQNHSGSITDTEIQQPRRSTFSFQDLGKEAA